jgi:hypothetical protein
VVDVVQADLVGIARTQFERDPLRSVNQNEFAELFASQWGRCSTLNTCRGLRGSTAPLMNSSQHCIQ